MTDARTRVLFADDEPIARRGLERMIALDGRLELVAGCVNGDEALQAIRTHRPAIAFLDIGMPGVSGLDVARRLPPEERPVIVFVTAFCDYAIEAFEIHAADYLLKPYDELRFGVAANRARERVLSRHLAPQHIDAMLETFAVRALARDQVIVKQGDNVLYIPMRDIDWCESADNYVRVNIGAKRYLVRETMQAMEQRLALHGFVRIHRNAIVNRARIRELRPTSNGEYTVILTTGDRLILSRSRRSALIPLAASARAIPAHALPSK